MAKEKKTETKKTEKDWWQRRAEQIENAKKK